VTASGQAAERVALGVRAPDVRGDRAEREIVFREVLRQRVEEALLPGRTGREERQLLQMPQLMHEAEILRREPLA